MTPRNQRFQKAYNVLVKAFFEGTLAKGTCVACACGNIIFDAVGRPVTKDELEDEIKLSNGISRPLVMSNKGEVAGPLWADKRGASIRKKSNCLGSEIIFEALPDFKDEINEAGYTAKEFAQIETAFEKNTKIICKHYFEHNEQEILEDQYKGLCAVVDVLLELENETEGGDELKQKFREHPKLQVA